jgi:hypothetical protein
VGQWTLETHARFCSGEKVGFTSREDSCKCNSRGQLLLQTWGVADWITVRCG